jgi:tellurium resistance protein TerD
LSINLQKGQRVDLTKGNAHLREIMVGLGWDEKNKSSRFLGRLLGGGSQIDCDASVILLDSADKMRRQDELVYYGNLKHASGSVRHMGDNLTGEGEGDDEQIFIDLREVPQEIHRLVFVVNIYECKRRKQDFGLIKNAFIRIVDAASKQELVKFNLTENYAGKTALTVGEVYRQEKDWKFVAIGEGTTETSLAEMTRRYK